MAQVKALVCCDVAVYLRGQWSLLNVFDALEFSDFPAEHPGWDVLVALADLRGTGEAEVAIEIADLEKEIVEPGTGRLFHHVQTVDLTGRPTREWLRFATDAARFEEPGLLEIRAFLDDELLETGTLWVRRRDHEA
jgi:hypothetical protein